MKYYINDKRVLGLYFKVRLKTSGFTPRYAIGYMLYSSNYIRVNGDVFTCVRKKDLR